MRISLNNMNDMNIIGMKSQMAMHQLMQKIGKGKRKVSILLDKSSQKFFATFMKEFKKNVEKTGDVSKIKNILSFADYVVSQTEPKKGQKRPKTISLLVSYEEQDFLAMQLAETVKGMVEAKKTLKWYNIFKKMMYKSYAVQCQSIYDIVKKSTI